MPLNRRNFLAGAATLAAGAAVPGTFRGQAPLYPPRHLPFQVAVINDEISPDFDHACHVVAKDFGLHFIEIRSMWGKNVADLDEQEIARARSLVAKYNLRVSDIASPLFKVALPGAETAPGIKVDEFNAKFTFAGQNEVLERSIHLARSFSSPQIRCFDFLRLADRARFLPDIHEHLRKTAAILAKDHLVLLLENEQTCNTATGAEAAATLAAVKNTNFMLNWDPGNAAYVGAVPYPKGYDLLPKNRIGHCHCKDVVHDASGKPHWAAVGTGVVDWRGQIEAFVRQKFHYVLSLETHWRGAGTAEASTRVSMAGLQKILASVSA